MTAPYTGENRRLQQDRRAVRAASKAADDAKWATRREGDRRAAVTPSPWQRLTDREWINVVNSDAVKDEGDDAHGAACQAFKLTEERCRVKNEPTIVRLSAERDQAVDALRKICRVDYRTALAGLDRPTEFAESQAKGMALGNAQETARKALKKLDGAA